MADRPQRRKRRVNRARVQRVERLSPHMIRVVLGGEGLEGFPAGEYTDHYIKLLFPAEGVSYPEPFDLERIREEFPREQWPRTRTYTVRRWVPAARELWVDFVHHGEEGLAGPWAARVRPGEEVFFMGPGGGYAPDEKAAYAFMNYLLRPEVMAGISNYVHYANGNLASEPLVDAAIKADPAIYPPQDKMAKLFALQSMPMKIDRLRTRIWTNVKTGK